MNRLIFFGCLLACPLLRADLVFATSAVDGGKAAFSDTQFTAAFPFKNEGEETVRILAVNSSCGCTTPTLPKMEYAPGESGVITAKFDFGSRTGYQEKKITVITDDVGDPARTVLKLSVTIPQILELEPRVLMWKDEQAVPKSVKIKLGEGVEATVRIQQPVPPGFDYTLEPASEADVDYLLTFTPQGEKNQRAKINLEVVDGRGEILATSFAFAIVR